MHLTECLRLAVNATRDTGGDGAISKVVENLFLFILIFGLRVLAGQIVDARTASRRNFAVHLTDCLRLAVNATRVLYDGRRKYNESKGRTKWPDMWDETWIC